MEMLAVALGEGLRQGTTALATVAKSLVVPTIVEEVAGSRYHEGSYRGGYGGGESYYGGRGPETQATISAKAVQSGRENSATSWWESGDTRKLFRPSTSDLGGNRSVEEVLMERIELLESVNRKGKSCVLNLGHGIWRHIPTLNWMSLHCNSDQYIWHWHCDN